MFNSMTLAAASELIVETLSHSDLDLLFEGWEIKHLVEGGSKSGRAAALTRESRDGNHVVYTERGQMPLGRALVEKAADRTYLEKLEVVYKRFVAGLRFDGFEIVENEVEEPSGQSSDPWSRPKVILTRELRKIYPSDVPGLEFREAESEVMMLLERFGFTQSIGHLRQGIRNFSSGAWASANGALRTFFESYLQEMAVGLGFTGRPDNAAEVRRFLGQNSTPILVEAYNEWNPDTNKPQFFQGLWSRMHPHGSHPGPSEEDDCTFRLHITLITARLLLRRYSRRP